MTISWNESAERPEQPTPTVTEAPPLPTGNEISNTFAPGTVYSINKNEYALTLEQDETTVTYFSIPKGQGKTVPGANVLLISFPVGSGGASVTVGVGCSGRSADSFQLIVIS